MSKVSPLLIASIPAIIKFLLIVVGTSSLVLGNRLILILTFSVPTNPISSSNPIESDTAINPDKNRESTLS